MECPILRNEQRVALISISDSGALESKSVPVMNPKTHMVPGNVTFHRFKRSYVTGEGVPFGCEQVPSACEAAS